MAECENLNVPSPNGCMSNMCDYVRYCYYGMGVCIVIYDSQYIIAIYGPISFTSFGSLYMPWRSKLMQIYCKVCNGCSNIDIDIVFSMVGIPA